MSSKKDYVALADIIAKEIKHDPKNVCEPDNAQYIRRGTAKRIAFAMSSYFAADSPNFMPCVFIAACGIDSYKN